MCYLELFLWLPLDSITLWINFEIVSTLLCNITFVSHLFPSRVALIFGQDLVLIKSIPAHPKRLSLGLRSGFYCNQCMCENDSSCSLNHPFTIWALWIVALSSWKLDMGMSITAINNPKLFCIYLNPNSAFFGQEVSFNAVVSNSVLGGPQLCRV